LKKLLASWKDARERHRERHRPTGFQFAIADSIHFLNPSHWDTVTASSSFFLQRRYLALLEEAGPEDLRLKCALIYGEGKPLAAIVAQILTVFGRSRPGRLPQKCKPSRNPFKRRRFPVRHPNVRAKMRDCHCLWHPGRAIARNGEDLRDDGSQRLPLTVNERALQAEIFRAGLLEQGQVRRWRKKLEEAVTVSQWDGFQEMNAVSNCKLKARGPMPAPVTLAASFQLGSSFFNGSSYSIAATATPHRLYPWRYFALHELSGLGAFFAFIPGRPNPASFRFAKQRSQAG